jgi:hypothetical protein
MPAGKKRDTILAKEIEVKVLDGGSSKRRENHANFDDCAHLSDHLSAGSGGFRRGEVQALSALPGRARQRKNL